MLRLMTLRECASDLWVTSVCSRWKMTVLLRKQGELRAKEDDRLYEGDRAEGEILLW